MVEVDVSVDPCVMSKWVRLLVSQDVLMHLWSNGMWVMQQSSAIWSDNTVRITVDQGLPIGTVTQKTGSHLEKISLQGQLWPRKQS